MTRAEEVLLNTAIRNGVPLLNASLASRPQGQGR